MKQAIPIDALLAAFYEIDLAKAANALVYSRGEAHTLTCVRCGDSYQTHLTTIGTPAIHPACLDCTCGDPFR